MVGNGKNGSGCWIKLSGRFRPQAAVLLYSLGVPQSALQGNLEEIYIEHIVSYIRNSPIEKAVLLAHELTRDDLGKPIENFGTLYVPNEVVLSLAQKHRELLAGVSIHPARPDALEELERCLDGGAALMKCLPNCQNINLSDSRFTKFWERMAKAGLPLLAHTGGELSLPVYRQEYCSPQYLELPLQCGVQVIGAHCGTKSLFFDTDYTLLFAEMLAKHPNLYGDNSGMMTPIRCQHMSKLLKSPFQERMIYGSDMPIPISPLWPFLWGFLSWADFKRLRKIKNPLTRDFEIKRAMGFSGESFRRGNKVLRLESSSELLPQGRE